jgi:hypothetical protein
MNKSLENLQMIRASRLWTFQLLGFEVFQFHLQKKTLQPQISHLTGLTGLIDGNLSQFYNFLIRTKSQVVGICFLQNNRILHVS